MRAAILALLALAGAADAHPHAETERQAALTLAPGGVTLRLTVVPGTEEGPAIAARIDADGDGVVSEAEAWIVAEELLAATALAADGAPVALRPSAAEADPPDWLAAGMGYVIVEAVAELSLAEVGTLALDVTHDAFGAGWFVQPYYADGLVETVGQPSIDRNGDGVVIRLDGQ